MRPATLGCVDVVPVISSMTDPTLSVPSMESNPKRMMSLHIPKL